MAKKQIKRKVGTEKISEFERRKDKFLKVFERLLKKDKVSGRISPPLH
jgi:hypothetical protein